MKNEPVSGIEVNEIANEALNLIKKNIREKYVDYDEQSQTLIFLRVINATFCGVYGACMDMGIKVENDLKDKI